MDDAFNWVRGHFHGEWMIVTGAPMLFSMSVLILSALACVLIRWFYLERMSALKATVDQKQSLLDEYKDRLSGQTPMEVAVEMANLKSTIAQLEKKVSRPQRRLSEDQKAKMAVFLDDHPEFKRFWFSISSTPDTESSRYCIEIYKYLISCGIQSQYNPPGHHDEGEYGITFYMPKENREGSVYDKMAKVFEKSGLKPSLGVDTFRPSASYIFVSPEED